MICEWWKAGLDVSEELGRRGHSTGAFVYNLHFIFISQIIIVMARSSSRIHEHKHRFIEHSNAFHPLVLRTVCPIYLLL
jgi:hypothetical protein